MPVAGPIIQSSLTFATTLLAARGIGIAADYEARGLASQARLARLRARQTLESGEQTAAFAGIEAARLAGTQRAGFATQGVDVDVGTARIVQEQTKEFGRRLEDTIRINAWRDAMGLRMESASLMSQSALIRLAGHVKQFDMLAAGGIVGARQLLPAFQRRDALTTEEFVQTMQPQTQAFNQRAPIGVPGSR